MTDPILQKAIEKRDEAVRETKRWEQWIETYGELADMDQADQLDIPMGRPAPTHPPPSNPLDLAAALRHRAPSTGTANLAGLWDRADSGEQK